MRKGRKSISQTPAPLKDRVKGSKKNPKGSAASKTAALSIKLSDSIISTLENKKDEYNKDHSKKVTLNTLKAVMRRGMGAYSTSHRPTISGGAPNSRQAWGFARVNKFLLKKGGTKVKAAYVQDDDLMAKGGVVKVSYDIHNIDYDSLDELFDDGYGFRSDMGIGEPHILLLEENKIIGCIFLNHNIFYDDSKDYEFDIVIKEDKRGKGYSKLLLDEMINDFVNNFKNSSDISANVINDELSKYLVSKYGFVCIGNGGFSKYDNICYLTREKAIEYLKNNKKMDDGGETGQEITCHNCGWHWNTNQSEKFDKYVCHKCGFDNKQYYMKKGGTLKKPPTLIEVAKKHKMPLASLMKPLKDGIATEMEHTKDKSTARTIALHHLYESPKYYEKLKKMEKSFKDGGEVVEHTMGKAGGVLVGRRHSQGGIKAVNKSNNQPLEMEGGEVVITRNAVSDGSKREFEGEMLTNKEILSRINESGGGVSFASGGKVKDCGCSGKTYKYGGKMMSDFDIVESIRGASQIPMNVNKGLLDMSGVQYSDLKPSEAVGKLFGKVKFEEGGVLEQVDDSVQLINKRLPSLKGFLKLERWIESPFEDDLSRYSPIKNLKNVIYAKGGNVDLGTITNAQAYKTYLFDNYGIKFMELPAKIQNALLMGEQKLIDNYINS